MRRATLIAIACCVLAYASVQQGVGWNQIASYGTVRALAHGHAEIDHYRNGTGDVAWYHGHYYSTKAPGLALLTLPFYVALEKTGALRLAAHFSSTHNPVVGALWALGLIGCVLPGGVILLLVRRLGDEVEPGYGALAAVTAGLGSLLLPFATLFFYHLLSTALALGAFAVAWLRRDRAWLAGLLAGLAIVCDYPMGLFAIAIGLYVLSRTGVRRTAEYAAGAVVGVIPLAVFDWFAFGSPFHLSYKDAVLIGGRSGHDVLGANDQGFFGVGWPSLHTAVNLLFSHIGLLTLGPVVAVGVAGWLTSGRRAETSVALGLAGAYLVYNSGYVDPFGGFTPGPRFLIPILPLLGIGLAPAYRRMPLVTAALAVPSILAMTAVTISGPLLAHDGGWWERIRIGHFLGHGAVQIVPLCLLAAAAVAAVVVSAPRPRLSWPGALSAGVALAGWLALALFGHRLLASASLGRAGSAAIVAAATAAAAALTWLAGRASSAAALP